jgi:predicted flap endonuclease-1-like 5' DNA nuclease
MAGSGLLGALTTVHFAIIAVLAVLAIIGIVYGMKLSRQRRAGTRELEASGHLERTGDRASADPDAPGEAVVARAPATLDEAAPGGDTAPVVQERAVPDTVREPEPAPVMAIPAGIADPLVSAPSPTPLPDVVFQVPEDVPAASGTDLTLLKGLGPKVAALLVEQDVPDIAALARLSDGEAEAVAARLGTFAPRMARDRWVEQARLLAAGDKAGFEAVFGKL